MTRSLRLFAWLALRNWRLHPFRQALSVLAIALGVSLYLAGETTLGSITRAVDASERALHGGADLTVARGAAGLSAEELERLAGVPHFETVTGMVLAHSRTESGGSLTLVGIDPTAVGRMAGGGVALRLAQGGLARLLLDPGALLLTEEGLEELGLEVGGSLRLATAVGERSFRVAGAATVPPGARAALRRHAFVALATAQALFGREGRMDRADIVLRPGVAPREGRRAALSAAGEGAWVVRPGELAATATASLQGMRAMLVLTSMLSLMVALLFVYNASAASVAERSAQAGLLRCIGLSGRGLQMLLLAEAAVAGGLGLAAGVLLGQGLARLSLALVVQSVEIVYFHVPPLQGLFPPAAAVVRAAALAMATSLAATWLASRRLARAGPIEILRPSGEGAAAAARMVRAAWVGGLLLGGAIALPLLVPPRSALPAGRITALALPAGIALLAPAVVLAAAGALRRLAAGSRRVSLVLALDAVRVHPARTAVTITAFALSLGLVVGHGALSTAMRNTLQDWMRRTIPGDILLAAGPPSPIPMLPVHEKALDPLREIDGVEEVIRVRLRPMPLGERTVVLLAFDVQAARERSEAAFVAGDPEDAVRRLAAGEAVVVSENLAWKTGLSSGDSIPLSTGRRTVALPVAGVVRDFNSPLGTVYLDISLYRSLFEDRLIDYGEICLAPGADAEAVLRSVEQALAGDFGFLTPVSREQFIRQALAVVGDLNALSLVQILVAMAIGCAAIMATVTLSVLTRAREFALLSALGMERRRLAGVLSLEVAGLVAAATAAGLCLGNLVFLPGNLVFRELAGFSFGHSFPAAHMLAAFAIAAATAAAAALIPLVCLRRSRDP